MTICTRHDGQWNPSWSGTIEPSRIPGTKFYPTLQAYLALRDAGVEKGNGCGSCSFDHDSPECSDHYCLGGIFLSNTHIVILKLEQ